MSFLLPSEPTLMIANLKTTLEEVELDDLGYILNVPHERRGATKEANIEEFIQNHPAPSWRLVADRLYDWGKYHTVFQNVKRKYLKGEEVLLCTHELNFVISLNWNHYPQQLKL